MSQPIPFSQWSDAEQWVNTRPAWVPAQHQSRVAAYGVYEEVFWSHVGVKKIMNRGLDAADSPLYVPSARVVVDTMDRYVGPGLTFAVNPEIGTPETQVAAKQWFGKLFARERFASRYNAAKRDNLLIKGDMLWHITYDPEKPPGARISLHTVDPSSYFPYFEDELPPGYEVPNPDPNRLGVVKLVELFPEGDEIVARVQTYDRVSQPGAILSSLEVWKQEEWFDPEKSPLRVVIPPTPLPPQVPAIPVYHIPNGGNGLDFGSSEMRGLLTLQAAMNQGVTDEDLALALMGIGVFATDETTTMRNEAGEVVPAFIFPGVILQNAKGLRRVEGVTDVQPYTDHFARLEGYMGDATGATDAARGRMEVTEAESGVALRLRLGPTLAKAAIKDQIITDVHAQMFYDLAQGWALLDPGDGIPAFQDVEVVPMLGEKLPVNRKEAVDLWSTLYVANLVSAASARKALAAVGFEFDPAEAELLLAEKVALAAAEGGDPAVDRTTNEVNGGSGLNTPPEE